MKYDKAVNVLLKEAYGPFPGIRVPTKEEDVESFNKGLYLGAEFCYVVGKILDPTGVLTIPDLIVTAKDLQKDPWNKLKIFLFLVNIICVLPGLTYYGKAIRGGLSSLKFALVADKLNIAINFILAGSLEGSTYVISKLPIEIQQNISNYLHQFLNSTPEEIQNYSNNINSLNCKHINNKNTKSLSPSLGD